MLIVLADDLATSDSTEIIDCIVCLLLSTELFAMVGVVVQQRTTEDFRTLLFIKCKLLRVLQSGWQQNNLQLFMPQLSSPPLKPSVYKNSCLYQYCILDLILLISYVISVIQHAILAWDMHVGLQSVASVSSGTRHNNCSDCTY